jgi:hypothetical protein
LAQRTAASSESAPKDLAPPVVVVTLPSLALYDQIATGLGEAA